MVSSASANQLALRDGCVRNEHALGALTLPFVAYRGPSNRSATDSRTIATCVVQLVRDMRGEYRTRPGGGLMERRNNDFAIPVTRPRGEVIP
jgi:hypothetical protein